MPDLLEHWQHAVHWFSVSGMMPLAQALGWSLPGGNPDDIAEAVLLAGLQLMIIGLIFRPLESLAPAERWADRRLTRVDLQYTLIMLLGLFPLFSYLVLTPLANYLGAGMAGSTGEESLFHITRWIPALEKHPVVLFLVYYLIYDLVYYCLHRVQHAIPWWWAMHSMHHSQRQLSCWSNDRGCYLDGFFQSIILAGVGLLIGVTPGEFALLMLLGELVQNFSHANVSIRFGYIVDKIIVSPTFHRLHHMVADPERPTLHNCNFAQVFPIWDILFGTALYGEKIRPTGVNDPIIDQDNGRGLINQQWETLKRFWVAFRQPAGWKPGEINFDAGYQPIAIAELELEKN